MRKRYYYKQLQEAGYGSRNKIKSWVEKDLFPPPYEDETGRPFWDEEQLEEQDAKQKQKQYTPAPIKPALRKHRQQKRMEVRK